MAAVATTVSLGCRCGAASAEEATSAAEAVAIGLLEEEDFGSFILQVPDALKEVEIAAPVKPSSTNETVVENPVQAVFRSGDGKCTVTVLTKLSSKIKPTFLQLTDIAQWGSVEEVGKLLLPRGAQVVKSSSTTVQIPPRDTRGVLGVVEYPPQSIYKYGYEGKDGSLVTIAVGASRGQVIVCGVSVKRGSYKAYKDVVTAVVDNFRVRP